MAEQAKQKHSFICSRGTLDGAYPALILAVNSVRQGHTAAVFYTFMGLNLVRKGYANKAKYFMPGFLGAIPGMTWLASTMMRKQIRAANIPEIEDLMEMAEMEGVKFVACHMTMQMMKLDKGELREGVEVMTAEDFMKNAETSAINMFT